MARETARVPGSYLEFRYSGNEPLSSFSDLVFGFLEDGEGTSLPESFEHGSEDLLDEDKGEEDDVGSVEEDKQFWETQNQLLEVNLKREARIQATLRKSSSLESRIRNATKEAIKEVKRRENVCVCRRPVEGGCRNCLMGEVSGHLQNGGYNSAIRKTKWRSSPNITAGEHVFLDVVDNSRSEREDTIRVIIELNFRAEFEMARASEEYNQLIRRLPEVFVGKVERLNTLIKILCSAAKKCMKERKMHIAPWRKQRYMQAKWLSTCETPLPLSFGYSNSKPKPKASMLTVDLLENLPNIMNCATVEVV